MVKKTFPSPLAKKLINHFSSPLYVYNAEVIRNCYKELRDSIPWKKTRLLYAAKANTNLHILELLQKEGAWLDVVSPFELEIGLRAGFKPEQILFTVNNMSDAEMHAAHEKKVLLNIDSISRLEKYGKTYPGSAVCVRLTPEVIAGHHKKVQTGYRETKFGILFEEVPIVLQLAKKYHLRIIGLHEHTGSGIHNMNVTISGMKRLMKTSLQFPDLQFLDFGGGFINPYKPEEKRFDLASFGKKVSALFSLFCKKYGRELYLYFEPGRYIVAESGVLLCTVTTLKNRFSKTQVGVDTGFNHLIRPVMYDSYHHITNLSSEGKQQKYDIYGNICESGDCFGKNRMLSEVHEGDILAIHDVGAYGMSMASAYNSRPLPTEVMIDKEEITLIRRRQKIDDLLREQLS